MSTRNVNSQIFVLGQNCTGQNKFKFIASGQDMTGQNRKF